MLVDVALLALFFALGLAVQRRAPEAALRDHAWTAYFWAITPVLVFAAFTTVEFDRGLGLALGAAVLATWLVVGVSFAYAALVSSDRDERGALALGAAFPNTGFVGYPLAYLALGSPGLALMVLYDRLAYLVPSTAVSTAIARLYGRREAGAGRRVRALVANPPLAAMLVAVGLRLAGVDAGGAAGPLEEAGALVVGPAGFFLLGLALPLERVAHEAGELGRAGGALVIRFGLAPLALFLCGRALGADVPAAFYLGAAMPCAFHLLILARVFDVRPRLVRLLVVGSTVPAIVAVLAVSALVR